MNTTLHSGNSISLKGFGTISRQFIQLLRVHNTRGMIAFFLIGRTLAKQPLLSSDVIISIFMFVTTYGFASIINHYYDRQIDRMNRRHNLFLDENSLSTVTTFILTILAGISLILPVYTSLPVVYGMTATGLLLLGWTYSHPVFNTSYHPIGKIVSMILTYSLIPGALGLLSGTPDHIDIAIVVALALYYASWLLYSDIKDINGDQFHGKRTLAVLLGVKRLCTVAAIASTGSLVLFTVLVQPLDGWGVANLIIGYTLLTFQWIVALIPTMILPKKVQQIGGYGLLVFFILVLISFIK